MSKSLYEQFNGTLIVKRYVRGYCYACSWAEGTSQEKIQKDIAIGDAVFFPFNESTGEYHWTSGRMAKGRRFKK